MRLAQLLRRGHSDAKLAKVHSLPFALGNLLCYVIHVLSPRDLKTVPGHQRLAGILLPLLGDPRMNPQVQSIAIHLLGDPRMHSQE